MQQYRARLQMLFTALLPRGKLLSVGRQLMLLNSK
jgi:hypothetical protein